MKMARLPNHTGLRLYVNERGRLRRDAQQRYQVCPPVLWRNGAEIS